MKPPIGKPIIREGTDGIYWRDSLLSTTEYPYRYLSDALRSASRLIHLRRQMEEDCS